MKLLNRSLIYLSGALLLALTVWAVLFYINMLDEVRDSIDDGLDNSKLLIIHEAKKDHSILDDDKFDEGNYKMREIPESLAKNHRDIYVDTLMYMENEEDFEPVRLLTTAFKAENGKFYELKVISSMVEEDDLIEDLFYSLLWLYLILIVSIFFINNLLLKSIWKPFYNILDKLKTFKLGSKQMIEPEKSSIEEFKVLNNTIQEVLRDSIDVYESQKQLIENASHEIQTPLAIAINKLQLFSEKYDLPEEQHTEIYQITRSLERLTKLNKSLLLLSKIENRQFREITEVNVNALLSELSEEFTAIAEHRNIEISLLENVALTVSAHRELLIILFTNLIKNSIVHNINGGVVQISISENQVVIENTGKDDALNEEKLFSRFYRENSSGQSTGLGLAIVKSICEMENIQISYQFSQVHRMSLKF